MNKLDASEYIYCPKTYVEEFHRLLCGIVSCYNIMVNENVKLVNDENLIRDKLLIDYLLNADIRSSVGLVYYLFDPEVRENKTGGRTDLKIQTPNTFLATDAYYIIECKRLGRNNQTGVSGLNSEYIKEGINRFVSKYYSTYCRVNGMIGFVVDKIDIHDNTRKINVLMNTKIECNLTREMKKENFISDFDYHYSSIHNDCENQEFTLYHLMFDFSKNIEDIPNVP